jgi:hypothetical protein
MHSRPPRECHVSADVGRHRRVLGYDCRRQLSAAIYIGMFGVDGSWENTLPKTPTVPCGTLVSKRLINLP